jgi:threonine/homoserine/homoserine lactone efflux protein
VGAVETLLALIAFSFVSSVTPGPNNVLLWASGATFGVARTVRHIFGTALGIGAMALAAAAGIAALVTTAPALGVAMKVGGSIYLLFLAFRIARSRGVGRAELARPLGLIQGAAFQLINPKAWIFALGAVTTFRPPEVPALAGSLLVAVTMMAVIVPTETLWAAAGGAINRLLTNDRRARVVSLALAALVVATVLSVWI